MIVSFSFPGQNHRRYRKPYGAVVVLAGLKMVKDYTKAEFAGTVGAGGDVYIECELGAVVCVGQVDERKPFASLKRYYFISSADHKELCTESEAMKYLIARKQALGQLAAV